MSGGDNKRQGRARQGKERGGQAGQRIQGRSSQAKQNASQDKFTHNQLTHGSLSPTRTPLFSLSPAYRSRSTITSNYTCHGQPTPPSSHHHRQRSTRPHHLHSQAPIPPPLTHKPVYKPRAPLSRHKRSVAAAATTTTTTALSSPTAATARLLHVPDLELATASRHRHPSRAGGGEASDGHVADAARAAAEGVPRELLAAR